MAQLVGRTGIGDAEFQVGSVDDGMYFGAIGLYNASGTSMTAAALRTALEDAQEVFVALEFVVGNDVYNSGPFPVFPASDDYDSTFVLNDQGTPWEDTTTIQVDTGMDAEGIALLAEFEDLLQAGIVDADFVGRFVDLIETGDYASESGTIYFYIEDQQRYVNKVVFGNNTLLDLTADTVSAGDLTLGITAHDRSGAPIVGTMPVPDDYIVETGNSSGWRYVKWNSGWLEAWGYEEFTSGSSETWGSWVGYKNTPVTMLNGDYYVFCQVQYWKWYRAYVGERTTTNFRVAVGSSGAGTDTVFFYLTGYWK